MFTGFKKITLDDLRKSHVVKDVQEYIINRLNSDFKDSIMLTKEIIESLHQLYIKSNGCILYLEKVLHGIKDNFFSFREIKLIPCTLNGLYLYICQKSFNKKQYMKIRPLLNVLLASSGYVDKLFLFNCLRTHNYTIDCQEFEKRLQLMRNILAYDSNAQRLKIFHNSFADWLVDVKFATKKFICDVNEGHVMISMYYLLVADTLCANTVRRFAYHLIRSGEYLTSRHVDLDLILMLLESRLNLSDCFYTNQMNCCAQCEHDFKYDVNFLPKTRAMLERFLASELSEPFAQFLCDFFKPSLPTDAKMLKLLIETGINNAESQNSCESSLMSPELSEKSQNIDFELADLLLSSEKSCLMETQRAGSPSEHSEPPAESQDENASSTLHQLSDSHHIELHKGKALIHILANDGNHQLLERALNACKSPIDLEIEDYNGQTALNIAARNGHLEVVKLLLSFSQPCNDGTGRMKRVDVNHADRDGWTPLRSASWGGHSEVVRLLIAQPACKIDLADKEGRTALRAAAWSGHEDILKLLIESGADVNSVDRQGRTSLIAASYMGHYDIVEILLENGANVNHLDLDGRSALCVAALCGSSGYSKVISTLLDHGANTDQLDNDGMSPLLVSSFEGNAEVCELLLENAADPDLADFMGRTPLWAACTAGHATVVKLLLFWGCGIDCMDSEGRTVLSIGAAQGNVETVRQLLDRGLDETHRDNAGWTPLHYAAFEGFHEVCLQLLESGAKIDECDNEGKTALHLAAQEGRLHCVQALLDIHSSFVDQKAHDGKTAFRLACLEGHMDTVEFLLKFCCDVNSKDADSRTTLYILALENKLEIVKYLLDMTNVDVNIPDSEGRTALHVAAWQGHADMVKTLIEAGADVNSMDLEARTPLHSCAWQGNHDVMNILLYYGALADHACKQGATALGISAQEGHEKCVIALLQFGANPYKSDHCGRTPIKLAAKSSRTSILKIFESYTKNEASNPNEPKFHAHASMLRSPDQPPALPLHQNLAPYPAHASASSVCSAATTATVHNGSHLHVLNASSSTHSSNNFYQNTMQSDTSSLHKRKSVISSQSTGSSNDQAPLTFTQQLQRQSKLSSRNNLMVNSKHASSSGAAGHKSSGGGGGAQRHSQVLPDLSEHQLASNMTNEADMYDMECMSPLYATPPHSPSSELSSPGQLPGLNAFVDDERAGTSSGGGAKLPDNHFARDTHMRIILGNLKENQPSSSGKSKRSGVSSNPAMRLIRSRFDAASQLIRRTNNILSSSSNQGSSSIGVKSGTFQWRKESQM
nr:SD03956p [Drosophila melanogaster]